MARVDPALACEALDLPAQVRAHSDGRPMLASGGADATVRIWDLETGEQRAVLEGHRGRRRRINTLSAVTAADGRRLLASASDDATVRIWDLETGGPRMVLRGHQDRVWAACPVTAADGRRLLASASDDTTVRIWDLSSGAALHTVPTDRRALAVAWTGRSLAIGLSVGLLVITLGTGT